MSATMSAKGKQFPAGDRRIDAKLFANLFAVGARRRYGPPP